MSAILAAQDFLATAGAVLNDTTIATATTVTGQSIATQIRAFVGPLVMLAVGLAALVFLFKREMTKFFQFAALAVGVAVFFFTPNFLESFGTWVGSIFGGSSTSLSTIPKS